MHHPTSLVVSNTIEKFEKSCSILSDISIFPDFIEKLLSVEFHSRIKGCLSYIKK